MLRPSHNILEACVKSSSLDAPLRATKRDLAQLLSIKEVSDETRIIVSEPLVDLAGAWNEVPESSYGLVCEGAGELHAFRPR
jgi:hypothetical protein